MAETFFFQCSECDAEMSLPLFLAGQKGKCPACGKAVQIEIPATVPNDPQVQDSLDDDRTFTGQRDTPREQQSLGDAGTHAGGFDSSISDVGDMGDTADLDLPLIDLAARYEIEGELGKGGMGAVQLATDRQLKRKVAIKRILARSQSAVNRFVTEAQSIAALSHFNIVQIHEFGRDADGPLLVLEYVSGGSLLDRLQDGKLEVEDAINITCQLCDALTLAHQKGIIHRDIKPANILLTEDGVPKLTDFGLARDQQADHGQTMAGTVMGTLDFMPPEQRRDATAVDARSDLWSLAATCYQMLTGKSPKVIRLDQLPANLAPVIGTMLEEDPEERYQAADVFKAELRKGMATVAARVAVNLAAGVCPSCGAANDASRKFCRGCRAFLIEPCMSCESDNPVWEDVCGQCGSSQQEQRDLIRDSLAAIIEESLTLARGHEYENALMQLSTVQEDEHAFTEDIRAQAAEQFTFVTAQRDEQFRLGIRERLVAVMEESLALASRHEFDMALVQLETVQQDQHDFTADLREQAAEQVTVVTVQKEEQYQLNVRKKITAVIEESLALVQWQAYDEALVKLEIVQQDQHDFTWDLREQAAEQIALVTAQKEELYQLNVREKLAAMIEDSLALAQAHEYEKALAQLETVQQDQHDFIEDLREQAAEQVTLVSAQRDEQHQLRDQQLERTSQHQQAHDYAAMVKELAGIPVPLQTEEIVTLLANAQAAHTELSSLTEQIRQAARTGLTLLAGTPQLKRLLENTARYLELNPGDEKMLALHEKLMAKANRDSTQIEGAVAQVKAAYENEQDEAVLKMLAHWPQDLQRPASIEVLQSKAAERLARVQELEAAIATETSASRKLKLINEYLLLRRGNKQKEELQQQTREEKKRQQKRTTINISCTTPAFLLMWVMFYWLWKNAEGWDNLVALVICVITVSPILCIRFLRLSVATTCFLMVVTSVVAKWMTSSIEVEILTAILLPLGLTALSIAMYWVIFRVMSGKK